MLYYNLISEKHPLKFTSPTPPWKSSSVSLKVFKYLKLLHEHFTARCTFSLWRPMEWIKHQAGLHVLCFSLPLSLFLSLSLSRPLMHWSALHTFTLGLSKMFKQGLVNWSECILFSLLFLSSIDLSSLFALVLSSFWRNEHNVPPFLDWILEVICGYGHMHLLSFLFEHKSILCKSMTQIEVVKKLFKSITTNHQYLLYTCHFSNNVKYESEFLITSTLNWFLLQGRTFT